MARSSLPMPFNASLGYLWAAWFLAGPKAEPSWTDVRAVPSGDELTSGVAPELWGASWRMANELLLPAIKAGRIGRLAYMDTTKAIPFYKYERHHEILSLIAQGDAALRGGYRRTAYFEEQASRVGAVTATIRVHRLRNLYHSVRVNGLEFDLERRQGLPFFFCARGVFLRLDGTHRSSVARFLGYPDLPVLVTTPADALGLPGLAEEHRRLLEGFAPPGPDAFRPVEVSMTQAELRDYLKANRNWYQGIDFGPLSRTLGHKGYRFSGLTYQDAGRRFGPARHLLKYRKPRMKNLAVMTALPDLTGRRVLDAGCNAGLYSAYAARRGASYVLGIDLDEGRVAQAREVLAIFRRLGKVTGEVEFRRDDIMANLDLLSGFDTVMFNCVLYHLGPVHDLKARIRASGITLMVVQCNTKRAHEIGRKNKPGAEGYEPGRKTWGNVLGTIEGARAFIEDCGLVVTTVTYPETQHPVLVGARPRDDPC